MTRYYFDTSIWLDFFEHRDEPQLLKTTIARALVKAITNTDARIVWSDAITEELMSFGYTDEEFETRVYPLRQILYAVAYAQKQSGKAKDLCRKREVPLYDALHALIARDCQAILVSRDAHFQQLRDIVRTKKPEEIIGDLADASLQVPLEPDGDPHQ